MPALQFKQSQYTFPTVAKPIIGGKTASQGMKTPPAAVQYVRIDEGSEGQRLDNFLTKILKGAPKPLVYRIIRSGEVRFGRHPFGPGR